MAVRLTFNTLLPMLYLYFRSIYLFHVILSSCLSSKLFIGPQHLPRWKRTKNETSIFFRIVLVLLKFNILIPVSFARVKAPLKLLFQYHISYNVPHYKIIEHHHHVMLPAWISLTLSCHLFLSSIAPGRSSRLYAVSAQSCCI